MNAPTTVYGQDEQPDYVTNPRGHVWISDGEHIDIFAYSSRGGHCNGPKCEKCGYGFCHHCTHGKAKQECSA